LELRVPLGEEIMQEIPIVNTGDKDVVIKSNIEGDNAFNG
jgi:hypothetical protein